MEMKDRPKRLNVVRALHEKLMRGTIHVGDIGEMVAALILLFTFDKLQTGGPAAGPRLVQLARFLNSLLPSEFYLQLKSCVNEDERMQNCGTLAMFSLTIL